MSKTPMPREHAVWLQAQLWNALGWYGPPTPLVNREDVYEQNHLRAREEATQFAATVDLPQCACGRGQVVSVFGCTTCEHEAGQRYHADLMGSRPTQAGPLT